MQQLAAALGRQPPDVESVVAALCFLLHRSAPDLPPLLTQEALGLLRVKVAGVRGSGQQPPMLGSRRSAALKKLNDLIGLEAVKHSFGSLSEQVGGH